MDEKRLIKLAQSGDFDAFSELIDAHKTKIYALARKLAKNRDDANDIVQETFLKAIENIDKFRGESSFGTWLYSIALNEARAVYAKQKETELKPLEEYLPFGKDGEHHHGSAKLFDWSDPHKIMEADELKRVLDKLIAELPYKYREAFLLRYVEELPVKEVANLIKESEASTKSRILRARLALRDQLSSTFEEHYGKKMQ
jgi:RNA polymerase sigma-70 factor (ECF subfamily)